MNRRFWVLVHRYAGLYMAVFLIVAGLTGSILAFDHEIGTWLNPEMNQLPVQDRPMLDPFTLRDRAQALLPGARFNFMELNYAPGEVVAFLYEPKTNAAAPSLGNTGILYLNPYTGEETARLNDLSDWPVTRHNFIFFVFALHSALHCGQAGGLLFGIAALIWTVDCFVGFFLTLPRPVPQELGANPSSASGPTSWWSRWRPSWRFVWRGRPYRINFNLHRAAGLWTWPMLFVFAVSTVSFNLPQVYMPVMKGLFHMPDVPNELPNLSQPQPDPGLSWRDAAAIGQRLVAEQASRHGFKLKSAPGTTYFSYDSMKGVFSYAAHGERDVGYHTPAVTVYFDGRTGELRGAAFASGENFATTFTSWVSALHGRTVGGRPVQILVGLMGLVIPALSFTGVYLWWKKRRNRPQSAPVVI
jgi:uncharacterized iron-regulated membrane protein